MGCKGPLQCPLETVEQEGFTPIWQDPGAGKGGMGEGEGWGVGGMGGGSGGQGWGGSQVSRDGSVGGWGGRAGGELGGTEENNRRGGYFQVGQHLHGLLLALTPPQHGCRQVGGQAGQLVPHQGNEG